MMRTGSMEDVTDMTHERARKGFHSAENGSAFGPHAEAPLDRRCLSSSPLSSAPPYNTTPCGNGDGPGSPDSGIPTLELYSPDVPAEGSKGPGLGFGSCTLSPEHDAPATLRLETTCVGGASSQRDSTSVDSTSSLSTDLSTTLSLGREDMVGDFVVTSSCSAVVDFHDFTHFSTVSQAPPPNSSSADPPQGSVPQPEGAVEKKASPIINFFNRGVFSRKQREAEAQTPPPTEQNRRLFGRDSKRENEKVGGAVSSRRSLRRNLDFEPLSTTALILEHRPSNLPAKPEDEAQRHRQQYEEMVAHAKKRELKEAQKRRKQLADRVKLEESIGNAALTWSQEILPNWNNMFSTKRVRDLWWQGLPPSVRGRVWSLAVGNDLNITHELYSICLSRAKEKWGAASTTTDTSSGDTGQSHADREASLELIKLDISRTFPSLCIFQQGGPYHDVLHSILGAYTCYRPDVGYVQGMSFIAAVLILNMNTADAFMAFANLLNKPCQMAFYRVHHSLMLTYFSAFEVFFEENLPKLFAHFKNHSLTPDLYLIDWIFTLYSKSLPLDVACRVWDVFCRDGEEFLFRTALGILRFYCDVLMNMDFIHMAQFLTRLPEQISTHAQSHTLFSSISSINMSCRTGTWTQVLQSLQKEPEHSSPGMNLTH